MCNDELEHVFGEKHIGVTADAEQRFEEHSAKVNNANSMVGLIRRAIPFWTSNCT